VVGGWRRLHNGKLHNFHASPDITKVIKSRKTRWAWHVERMGEIRNVYKILVRKFEGKRPLRRPTRRWEDNIIIDLRVIGWEVVDWIHLAQDRNQWRVVVKTVMNLRVPSKVGNFLTN
jgi:hypothetical protein